MNISRAALKVDLKYEKAVYNAFCKHNVEIIEWNYTTNREAVFIVVAGGSFNAALEDATKAIQLREPSFQSFEPTYMPDLPLDRQPES